MKSAFLEKDHENGNGLQNRNPRATVAFSVAQRSILAFGLAGGVSSTKRDKQETASGVSRCQGGDTPVLIQTCIVNVSRAAHEPRADLQVIEPRTPQRAAVLGEFRGERIGHGAMKPVWVIGGPSAPLRDSRISPAWRGSRRAWRLYRLARYIRRHHRD